MRRLRRLGRGDEPAAAASDLSLRPAGLRRTLVLWLLLFAAYAATIGLNAFGASDYAGAEPHHLLIAESIVEDGDFDLRNQYAARAYEDFYPRKLRPQGRETEGRLHEPYGIGFAAFIAPAYARRGREGRRAVPGGDRRARRGARIPAGAARRARPVGARRGAGGRTVAAAARLRHRGHARGRGGRRARGRRAARGQARRAPGRRDAIGCFALLGALPWLGIRFAAAGLLVGYVAARALWRARRRTLAVGSVELALFSLALYVGLNEALFGGPTPTRRSLPARAPPAHPSPSATSSAATGSSRCSSTATSGCCAGRPCCCSPSRGSGGSGARTATGSPAPSRSCARSSSPRPVRRRARRPAAGGGLPRADDGRLLVPGAPPARGAAARLSRWWPGACAMRRASAPRWPRSRSRRRSGSTWMSAGATDRSSPTGPTRRSARSPMLLPSFAGGGPGRPRWQTVRHGDADTARRLVEALPDVEEGPRTAPLRGRCAASSSAACATTTPCSSPRSTRARSGC